MGVRDGSPVEQAIRWILDSRSTVALTGAGVSVASGIPHFRSPQGIWSRWDPERYATLTAFRRRPEEVWRFFRDLRSLCRGARPNPAHTALADLERAGLLAAVLTQNVDGLHEAAGSTVVALHGRGDILRCLRCGHVEAEWPDESIPVPSCASCGAPLKVDAILFEEALERQTLDRAERWASNCELMLVVGTSAQVYPVAGLPLLAVGCGARLIEVNPERTGLADVSLRLEGLAEEILPRLAEGVRKARI